MRMSMFKTVDAAPAAPDVGRVFTGMGGASTERVTKILGDIGSLSAAELRAVNQALEYAGGGGHAATPAGQVTMSDGNPARKMNEAARKMWGDIDRKHAAAANER